MNTRYFIISELAMECDEVFEVDKPEVEPRDSGWYIARHWKHDEYFKILEWRSDRNHIEVEVRMKQGGSEDVAIALADVTYKVLCDEMLKRREIVARTRKEQQS